MSIKRGMSVQWLHGCSTVKEREDRKNLIQGSSVAFEVLLKIVDREREEVLAAREADYNDSSWAFKQAHLNGRIEELDRLHHLLRSAIDHNEP